jgi:hypothetical protein
MLLLVVLEDLIGGLSAPRRCLNGAEIVALLLLKWLLVSPMLWFAGGWGLGCSFILACG